MPKSRRRFRQIEGAVADVEPPGALNDAGIASRLRSPPSKILAFAKGEFAQTRFRFDEAEQH
jgi:hypothetical protein